MKEKMMEKIQKNWNQDRLYTVMVTCWLLTVVFSFTYSAIFSVTVPMVGELYPFRILLPITMILYLLWAFQNKESFWQDVSTIEKWCYVLCAILLVYGGLSLFRALDFTWTLKRLFNLTLDVCFFFLVLRLCRRSTIRKWTIVLCGVMLGLMIILGIYEVFFGGIWNDGYDNFKRVFFFNNIYQYPILTYGNTNDYNSSLVFLFVTLLLYKLRPGIPKSPGVFISMIFGMSLLYFIVIASNARLNWVGTCILIIGLTVYLIFVNVPGRTWLVLLLLLGVLFTEFSTRYYYLMPQINEYIEYVQTRKPSTSIDPVQPETPPVETPQKPTIDLSAPNSITLQEEIFSYNEESGTQEFNLDGSGGVRIRLLVHAMECFLDSKCFGVGLGNTEILARDGEVVITSKGQHISAIHCFVARLVADYGVFVLIPLVAIGFLLLRNVINTFLSAIQKRDWEWLGYEMFALTALLIYPFVSTASSDSQDILSMWIYLGMLVVFFGNIASIHKCRKDNTYA